MLEKHKLQLQLSKHGAPGAAAAGTAAKKAAAAKAAAAKAAGTKLVVRNVAFEATRKDLMGLFGPFGHIKSCRCEGAKKGQYLTMRCRDICSCCDSKCTAAGQCAYVLMAHCVLRVGPAWQTARSLHCCISGPCRLPKKFDGNHRGFAFLEFTTKQEAQNALEGVGGTHLYGRRLVVEYAQVILHGLLTLLLLCAAGDSFWFTVLGMHTVHDGWLLGLI
jgi:RNA recognition motif-containing protein